MHAMLYSGQSRSASADCGDPEFLELAIHIAKAGCQGVPGGNRQPSDSVPAGGEPVHYVTLATIGVVEIMTGMETGGWISGPGFPAPLIAAVCPRVYNAGVSFEDLNRLLS
jgi:hypothetical protein